MEGRHHMDKKFRLFYIGVVFTIITGCIALGAISSGCSGFTGDGYEILLEVDREYYAGAVTPEQMKETIEIIRKKLNPGWMKKVIVKQTGPESISVKTPRPEEPDLIKKMLGQPSALKFVDMRVDWLEPRTKVRFILDASLREDTTKDVEPKAEYETPTKTTEPESSNALDETGDELPEIIIDPNSEANQVIITGEDIDWVETTFYGKNPVVYFRVTKEGGDILANHTSKNIGKWMAIILNDEVISCPVIRERIKRNGHIYGFTLNEAKELEMLLNAGRIPLPLKVVDVRSLAEAGTSE